MILLKLFLGFLKVGALSFGGGYAAMPLIQSVAVDSNGWLSLSEFADIIAISEMTPGPIAINSATFVGMRVYGVPGAIAATLGCVTPSLIIVTVLAYVYYRFRGLGIVKGILAGLRPAVIAMIGSAGLTLLILAVYGQRELPKDLLSISLPALAITIAAFILLRIKKLNPIYIILGSGIVGLFLAFSC